jgi:hypothetical protein
MNLKLDRISGLAAIVFAVFLIIHIITTLRLGNHLHPGPGYVPFLLASSMAILGIIIFFKGDPERTFKSIQWTGYKHVLFIIGCCFFAIFALERLGYRLTTTIILLVLFGIVERIKIWLVIVLTLSLSLGSFWIFRSVLKVPLPQGFF